MPAQIVVPKPSQIRDSILRVIRAKLLAQGVPNPNVTATSDYFITAEAISQEISVLLANLQITADQVLPDTAEGDDLTRHLDIYELQPREAQPAAGNVVLVSSASTFIATGTQLIDGSGKVYEVTVGGTYVNGDSVPIQGVNTGVDTNHPQGTVLRWVSAPSFADPNALVAVGGLTGGANADLDETSRNRLFTYFRNPPQGGNWSQVKGWAEEASASVQAAYVYPAENGPSTLSVCVVGPLTFDATDGWSRGVTDAVLATVEAFLLSRLPGGVNPGLVVKTPKDTGGATPNVDTSVAIGLSLPLSVTGGGPGGGWIDADPWPDLFGTSTRVYVSAVTSSTVFTLTSDDPSTTPSDTNLIVGETQVAWFSNQQFADGLDPIITATVTAVSGTTGALQITVSVPFTGIAAGDFVFPNAENVQSYAQAYLASMNDMGPGQWTTHPQILVDGSRYPLVTASNPSDLTATLLRAIEDAGDEVEDTAYLYRSATNPGTPISTTADSPQIFVPKVFGFFNKIP